MWPQSRRCSWITACLAMGILRGEAIAAVRCGVAAASAGPGAAADGTVLLGPASSTDNGLPAVKKQRSILLE